MLHFESLLTAVTAAEGCAMSHELRAGTGAGGEVPSSLGVGGGASTAAAAGAASAGGGGGKKKKRVRFCAYDLSTVDMPSDAIEDSDVAGVAFFFSIFLLFSEVCLPCPPLSLFQCYLEVQV